MNQHETNPAIISAENLLEIQYQLGRALRFMPDAVAKRILGNKKEFQKFLRQISKGLSIPLLSENAFAQIPMLEKYFNEVYSLTINFSELVFPESDKFQAFMGAPPTLNEDNIVEAIKKHFKTDFYLYKNPVSENIDRAKEQQRPSGLYIFAHAGQDEPDTNHRNKSYNMAIAERFPFANAKEYLLMTGFCKFTKGYFLDVKGYTRTSSVWSNGRLVNGNWNTNNSRPYLNNNDVDNRNDNSGPREKFLQNLAISRGFDLYILSSHLSFLKFQSEALQFLCMFFDQ